MRRKVGNSNETEFSDIAIVFYKSQAVRVSIYTQEWKEKIQRSLDQAGNWIM